MMDRTVRMAHGPHGNGREQSSYVSAGLRDRMGDEDSRGRVADLGGILRSLHRGRGPG